MEFNYTPVGNKIVVLQDKVEDKVVNGIIIPSTTQEKPNKGTIIACPSTIDLKQGDRVIFSKFAGTKIEVEKVEYLLLKEDDIFLVEL